jgi:micrococcal nuclease
MNSQNRLRSLLLIVPLLIACNFSDRLSAAASAFMETTEESTPPYKELEGIECIPDISGVETAQVVRVIDGDSIEVELNGKKVQVRYIGINTPEYYSDERDEAIKASDANKDLVEGKTIYMFKDQSDTDHYGRLLRYVLTDQAFVNLELVRRGYAEAKEYPPDTACHQVFEKAE